jgi:homoserine dehydrogenase
MIVAEEGAALSAAEAALAEERGVALAEASVAGGIPVVKTLREGVAGNSIERVYGILNGTCNYTRMESEGLTFAQCLGEAQKLGYLAIFIGKPIPRPDRFSNRDRRAWATFEMSVA